LQQRHSLLLERLSATQINGARDIERVRAPTFDGSRSWEVFAAQFQSAADNNGWPPAERGRRLLNALQGPAADIVQTLPPAEYENYASLSGRLSEHFGSSQRRSLAEAELTRRTQKDGESLRDFGTDILRLARIAYPTWPEDAVQTTSRNAFLAGIADAEVRRAVRLRQPASLSDALAAAVHIEAVDRLEPAQKKARVCQASATVTGVPTSSAAGPSREPVDESVVAETRRVGAQGSNSGTAENDRKLNLLIDELRKLAQALQTPGKSPDSRDSRVRCFGCNQLGHRRANCPRNRTGYDDRRDRGNDRRRNDKEAKRSPGKE
jgi:hypothetical protein